MTKVLLIDDDRKHSALMQAYFKRFDINLICAFDSVEGFKKLAREEPDLLLLDIMLPGKDGFEICREVRKTSNIPIIMLTARGDVIDRVSGLELGADDYIGKPESWSRGFRRYCAAQTLPGRQKASSTLRV
jgi:OmpR family response regulator RpaB